MPQVNPKAYRSKHRKPSSAITLWASALVVLAIVLTIGAVL